MEPGSSSGCEPAPSGYEPARRGAELRKPKGFQGYWPRPAVFTPQNPGPRGRVHWDTEAEAREAEIAYRKAETDPNWFDGSKQWEEMTEKEKLDCIFMDKDCPIYKMPPEWHPEAISQQLWSLLEYPVVVNGVKYLRDYDPLRWPQFADKPDFQVMIRCGFIPEEYPPDEELITYMNLAEPNWVDWGPLPEDELPPGYEPAGGSKPDALEDHRLYDLVHESRCSWETGSDDSGADTHWGLYKHKCTLRILTGHHTEQPGGSTYIADSTQVATPQGSQMSEDKTAMSQHEAERTPTSSQ